MANLLVPESVEGNDGSLGGEAYVEIGTDDVEYERLAADALTQEEFDERRRRWQEGDESLRRQFLDFLARRGSPGRAQSAEETRGPREVSLGRPVFAIGRLCSSMAPARPI